MSTLTAAEIKQHPEFNHVFWDLKPEKKGIAKVAESRGGPIDIAWEIHGHGPTKIVWIMGLGGFKEAWQRQTRDFSHAHPDKYTSLVFDNRGIGQSSTPTMRYSTSEMAKDLHEVLTQLGWTSSPRSLNLVGISMGGMISQEFCLLAPELVASVTFTSTAPRVVNTVGVIENVRNRVNLFIPKSIDNQIQHAAYNLYSPAYLAAPDGTEAVVKAFPTNGDRFAAGEIRKRTDSERFSKIGFVCQALAAGWHHKSPAQLAELADKIGRSRIAVIHGTEDKMLTFPHGEMLLADLGGEAKGVSKFFFPGLGHVIPHEERAQFKEIVDGMIAKGQEANKKEGIKTSS